MAYPGQQYHTNHGNYSYPPQQPPQGQGGFYGPPPGAPPPNLASNPYPYQAPNGPPPNAYNNAYRQGNYGAPPPPPQHAQMFNQQMGQQYTFQYSNCTGKRKVPPSHHFH
jgi:metacaspase-1